MKYILWVLDMFENVSGSFFYCKTRIFLQNSKIFENKGVIEEILLLVIVRNGPN